MNVLIIEDEDYQARMLKKLLQKRDVEVLDVLNSVADSIKFLSEQTPDLVFMDVELTDGVCFDIFNEIQFKAPVIFVTNHTNFSLEAFYSNGIHYLVKPITEGRLEEGLNKYYSLKESLGSTGEVNPNGIVQQDVKLAESKILIRVGKDKIPMPQDSLALFYIVDGFVYLINTEGKKYLIDHNIDAMSQQLDQTRFFRLNRQFIVHIHSVTSFSTFTRGRLKVNIKPFMDESVIVSFKNRGLFLDWMKQNI